MDPEGPDAARHRLQDLLVDADPDRQALYWRQLDETGTETGGSDPRTIPPLHRLRFDTFVNCFYERYWRDLTGLTTLRLVVVTSGPCHIRLLRHRPGQPRTILAELEAQAPQARSSLAVAFDRLPAEDAFLYAEIEALDREVLFHEGTWLTDDPARTAVRLAIVICSFGREAMLVDNLRRMAPVVARAEAVGTLLVVRQGGRDLADVPAYAELATAAACGGKLRLVVQENFGGTGGFVRGIIEALAADATHVLLLDDDIRIEPAVIERLAALAAHLRAPTIVGGQMLDLGRPTLMHASHETVAFDRLRLHNPCRDTELGPPDALDLFAQRQSSDYNAWWLCCIPASIIRRIGLPMPMFIRHDDVEYGVRAIAAGHPLVTMPGIFVWHEPFTKKNLTPSFIYYERRNFMIAAALHGMTNPVWLMLHHWRDAWIGLRRRRFDYCWAVCRAAEDFLEGPAFVFSDLRALHRQVMADQARFSLLTVAGLRERGRGRRATPLALALLGSSAAADPAAAKTAAATRQLAVAILRTGWALLWRSRRLAACYRAEAVTYARPAFWRRMLGLAPDARASS